MWKPSASMTRSACMAATSSASFSVGARPSPQRSPYSDGSGRRSLAWNSGSSSSTVCTARTSATSWLLEQAEAAAADVDKDRGAIRFTKLATFARAKASTAVMVSAAASLLVPFSSASEKPSMSSTSSLWGSSTSTCSTSGASLSGCRNGIVAVVYVARPRIQSAWKSTWRSSRPRAPIRHRRMKFLQPHR
ncbi:hypothetical protein DQ04_24621000 [Trypanosoma grayi]|uniref:hypothetical protein n=1 Tax=Trypanosoma grayi TaxID=71804 RepID=UPI0004F41567|nr:hypothetical protein DQ04_24621000 [Trypanosoma grayi]KEG05251.1 hypothetical protein DQ04_24621000 [Trypanosoma grayi]